MKLAGIQEAVTSAPLSECGYDVAFVNPIGSVYSALLSKSFYQAAWTFSEAERRAGNPKNSREGRHAPRLGAPGQPDRISTFAKQQ